MKHSFKKVLSVFLAAIMICSLLLPATAAEKIDIEKTKSQIPIVFVKGDAGKFIDKDGNEFDMNSSLPGVDGNDVDTQGLVKSIANVLMPFLVQGLVFDNWEPYYENLQKELSDLFGDLMLDDNGEVANGSHAKGVEDNDKIKNIDKKGSKGYYAVNDYYFWYDWRLDPLVIADQLKDFIDCIKKATNQDKIALYSSCLGSNVAFAYISKYGTDDLYGLGISSSPGLGVTPLSEAISGQFSLDGTATARAVADWMPGTEGTLKFLGDFLIATLDVAEKSGAFDAVIGVTKATLYDKLVKGVTSAIVRGTIINFPCYWACVSEEDFDKALNMVFGEPGSETYVKHEKLIEKITNYNEKVKKNIPQMIEDLVADENIRLAIVAKYGFQLLPLSKSRDKVGDMFTTVEKASFGATASTIYEPLSDEYIASRVEAGFGKYISPDKQIDASTAAARDYTWYLKNVTHTISSPAEQKIIAAVITNEKKLTIDDLSATQFSVSNDEGDTIEIMTEENCHTERWLADEKYDKPTSPVGKLWSLIRSVFNWIKKFVSLITNIGKK